MVGVAIDPLNFDFEQREEGKQLKTNTFLSEERNKKIHNKSTCKRISFNKILRSEKLRTVQCKAKKEILLLRYTKRFRRPERKYAVSIWSVLRMTKKWHS